MSHPPGNQRTHDIFFTYFSSKSGFGYIQLHILINSSLQSSKPFVYIFGKFLKTCARNFDEPLKFELLMNIFFFFRLAIPSWHCSSSQSIKVDKPTCILFGSCRTWTIYTLSRYQQSSFPSFFLQRNFFISVLSIVRLSMDQILTSLGCCPSPDLSSLLFHHSSQRATNQSSSSILCYSIQKNCLWLSKKYLTNLRRRIIWLEMSLTKEYVKIFDVVFVVLFNINDAWSLQEYSSS